MDNQIASVGNIDSDKIFDDIEHHFRISAGPGAGKTHWLVNHIKQVLHRSERLGKCRKIACITYTNTGVEIIQNRLGSSANQVDVSTIHSFLYRHIIKPYMHFIADEFGFNTAKLDGHDDFIVSKGKCLQWLKEHQNSSLIKKEINNNQLHGLYITGLIEWLSTISCKFDDKDGLYFYFKKKLSIHNYRKEALKALQKYPNIFVDQPIKFKAIYWRDGIMHHDDVLFFSFKIIEKYPFVLDIVRAKFPYFFVDEFQDSNPIQVEILRKIGQSETVVGIIGDKAQSIFGFQGAEAEQFEQFTLAGIKDYIICNNRRSTRQIIDFLNHVRSDLTQQGQDDFYGNKPIIYVGDRLEIISHIKNELGNEILTTLSWKNITANALKKETESKDLNDELLDDFFNKYDNNSSRYRLVVPCIKAIELCREKKIKEALKELKRYFGSDNEGKKCALELLFAMNSHYDKYYDDTLMTFYQTLKSCSGISGLSGFKSGKPKDFYDNTSYKNLALCVNIVEDQSNNITIHKSKGNEFDNVLLVLENEKDISFIISPKLDSEESRLKYVAISRAIKNLYISVPAIHKKELNQLQQLEIVEVIKC
ncbi:UvrD-helicase domain-containing protein [Psychrobacter sp. I-STPA6b]|uniref:UvrD-helicase domain-containing protein n=1 Tax=Psychrobacter sp. I-STPA6b TaxID=2585718 RepID=UPI001D0C20D8|nr:ATP-dependent helicase [Psychrobacter sp. I-STPA6b]